MGYSVRASGSLFRAPELDNLSDMTVLKSDRAMFKVKKPVENAEVAEAKTKEIY
jgi:hypothetical protein